MNFHRICFSTSNFASNFGGSLPICLCLCVRSFVLTANIRTRRQFLSARQPCWRKMYFSSAPVCLSICVCVSVRAKTVYEMLVLSRSSINSMLSTVDTGVMTSSTVVPRFSIEPQSSVVRTGSAVALTCAVEPQTASIRWALNGSTISPQAARRLSLIHI